MRGQSVTLEDAPGKRRSVYRSTQDGYLHVLGATREETMRAEPFDAIELKLAVLFGADED